MSVFGVGKNKTSVEVNQEEEEAKELVEKEDQGWYKQLSIFSRAVI